MRKTRFMNMPVLIWLVGIAIAFFTVAVLINTVSEVFLTIAAVAVLPMLWFCWDIAAPSVGEREYVWLCCECRTLGLVVVPSYIRYVDVEIWQTYVSERVISRAYRIV